MCVCKMYVYVLDAYIVQLAYQVPAVVGDDTRITEQRKPR